MRSACLLQDLMGNQSGTVCGNTLSNTLSHFRSHEGGHLHSYWARRSDVLGLSSHIQIYVHKGLYNTNLCTQRLVYIRQSPSRFCVQAIAELEPQKSRNVAFGIPKTMKSCPSHCETAATGQSLTHGSNCCEEGRKKSLVRQTFCTQTIATPSRC